MPGRARTILFVTSNGTGLGHLTRAMAIARRLDPSLEPLVLTLSAAAPVVRELGFPVEYVASYGTPGAGSDWRWSRRLRGRLRAAIAEAGPRIVVFDGAHPYQALIDALGALAGYARSGAGGRCGGRAPTRGRLREAGCSTPCSSRASSPPARIAARRWPDATRRTAWGRSSSAKTASSWREPTPSASWAWSPARSTS